MKLAVTYNKEALRHEGDESVMYCSICKSVIRMGKYRTLFCAKCGLVESENVVIDLVMSCAHCEKPIAANMNYDGRVTARCENEDCGDCWSMQDLCLIRLNKSIKPKRNEYSDPARVICSVHTTKTIDNEWVGVKTLNFCELKREIFNCLSKINPHLIKVENVQTLINKALVAAIELNYQRLININTGKNMWYSITGLMEESGAKRDVVVSVFKKFLRESCSYEKRFYTKQQGRARYIHFDIHTFIMEQIKYQINHD